ncbi:signal peptidase I [Flavobacterium sp. MAHUQ-51]|uniref:signal peptidase I n=1 Tax=Flavobacterium sp. GCM10022190 TaxID=3252639 RepID=UPI00362401F1
MKKTYRNTILIIVALILVLLGIVWLAIILIMFVLIYKIVLHFISLIFYSFLRKMVKGFFLFLLLLSATICTKLLAFDIYKIPSSSMENLLYPQDVVVVNKLKYGPRLPRSPFEIPWVNIAFYFNEKAKKRIKEDWWDYKRLACTAVIRQGDVFVFNSTWSKDYILIKRCMGLAGDTLRIKEGAVYTNRKLFVPTITERNNYKFRIKNKEAFYKFLDSLELDYVTLRKIDNQVCEANLSKGDLDQLKKANLINTTSIQLDSFNGNNGLFCNVPNKQWTYDTMGPFVVPKKGMQILLNSETFSLYQATINGSENAKITVSDGDYYLDNKKIKTYTFKQNYYFMMGDHRKGTMDSRTWGFIPETNIIGKVQCVLYSNKDDEFQWNRFFKML